MATERIKRRSSHSCLQIHDVRGEEEGIFNRLRPRVPVSTVKLSRSTNTRCTPRSLARRRTRVKIEESITQLLHSSIISSFRRSEFWLWDFLCGRRVQRGVGENSVGVGERDDGTHPFHEQAGFLSYLKWKEETEIEMYEGILQTGRLNGSTLEPACEVHG